MRYIRRDFAVFARFSLAALGALLLVACGSAEDQKADYFERGMELYEAGNYTKARLEFKNVLQIDPKDAEAYFMFGQIEEHSQNWRQAYALFLRAVELKPEHVGAQLHLGRLYALSGSPEKALESADTALKNSPDNAAAMALKGLARAKLGENEAAVRNALAAIEIDPKNEQAVSLLALLYADEGRLDEAIRLAKQAIELNPDRMGFHLLLAGFYEKAGNEAGVVELLEKMVALNPEDLSRRVRLAGYYRGKGDNQKAEQVLEEAIAILPENDDANLALVELIQKQGDNRRAMEVLQGFVSQAPDSYRLQLKLAGLQVAGGDRQAARDNLRGIIEGAGTDAEGLTARTKLATLMLADKETDQSLALVEEVLAENPKDKEALLIRAAISMGADDADKGMADLRVILREDPGYVKALRLKARAHLQKNEIQLARQSLEDAILAQPQEAAANFELVQILMKTGELDGAIDVLEKMLQFAPDDLQVLQGLAILYTGKKAWDEVGRIADVIVDKHPDNALGYYYRGMSQQGEGKLKESIAAFEQSLEIRPNAVEPLVALAQSLRALGKTDDALTRTQVVIAANPQNFLALNLQGELYLSLGRLAEAEDAFNKAIGVKPEWRVPYENLARMRSAQGDRPGLLNVIRQGYENTDDPVIGVTLATLLDQSGKSEEAKVIYRDLLEKRPGLTVAANNLAMLLIRGEPEDETLDEALALVEGLVLSEVPVYLDTLGWVYVKRGEFQKGLEVLERAARANADIPEINYHLGVAYYELGRKDDARKQFDLALASGKEFEGLDQMNEVRKRL